MNIIENIKIDFNNARDNNEKLLKYALGELLNSIGNFSSKKKMFNNIESMIEDRAQKIMRNKRNNVETDAYLMNIFNLYLEKFFFNKKRQIILIYDENTGSNQIDYHFNKTNEQEPKIIHYKKKRLKINFIKNLFSK